VRLFALGDPHLPGGKRDRPMHRFGPQWWHHREKILKRAWQTVGPTDILLLPGDLSWASKRRDALGDLAFLTELPGTKICIKGNHDFWWESEKPIGFPGLLSPPVILGEWGFAGARGCDIEEGEVTLARERRRLEKSLMAIVEAPRKCVLIHHPPQLFADLLEEHGVEICVFGHVHKDSFPQHEALVLNGELLGKTRCWCVACDRIEFTPKEIRLPEEPVSLTS
jgi:uncharacterized protein